MCVLYSNKYGLHTCISYVVRNDSLYWGWDYLVAVLYVKIIIITYEEKILDFLKINIRFNQ